MRKLKKREYLLDVDSSSCAFFGYRKMFVEALLKKPSLSSRDRSVSMLSIAANSVSRNSVGYVNLNMLNYLLSNIESFKGTFRQMKCKTKARKALNKTQEVNLWVKTAQFAFKAYEEVEYDNRYNEVLDGLSQVALGTLTNYKDINRVKMRFTNTLTKNRSTAFFNVGSSSRTFPNKADVFSNLFSSVIEYSASADSEMMKLALACTYTNPYSSLLRCPANYHVLYKDSEGVNIATELNAVCSTISHEYFTLVESNNFLLLLQIILDFGSLDDSFIDKYAEEIAELCSYFVITNKFVTAEAVQLLKMVTPVRLLEI